MAFIHLTTFIQAPASLVFDLSRSVEVHQTSMAANGEKAIAGTTHGLLQNGDTVTWQARHFFKTRQLQTAITSMEHGKYFKDEKVKGDFKMMQHEHHFKQVANGTIMIDIFWFEVPYGFLGKLVEKWFLKKYMTRLLEQRNLHIKMLAETGEGEKRIYKTTNSTDQLIKKR